MSISIHYKPGVLPYDNFTQTRWNLCRHSMKILFKHSKVINDVRGHWLWQVSWPTGKFKCISWMIFEWATSISELPEAFLLTEVRKSQYREWRRINIAKAMLPLWALHNTMLSFRLINALFVCVQKPVFTKMAPMSFFCFQKKGTSC